MYSYLIGDIMTPTWGGGGETLGHAYWKLCNSHRPEYTFGVNWHTEVVFAWLG